MRVLLESVVASDRRYFELGASAEPLPGAVLLHLPGSAGVGAGTVVWVDDAAVVTKSPGWVEAAAVAARRCGAPALRVYGLAPDGPAADRCHAAGMTSRQELAYVGVGGDADGAGSRIEIRPADDEAGRDARRRVAGGATSAPDGHPIDAEAFLAGEELRAATGALELFVAWDGEEPVAVVGALRQGDLLRLKNLLIRPDRRREGIAKAVTSTLLGWARDEDRVLGTVALAGDHGERIYRSLDMAVAGEYTEWSMELPESGRPPGIDVHRA